MKKNLAIIWLLAFQINAYSFEDPIVTDRPGYTDSTHTVRPGRYVVELGYQYAFNNNRARQVTQSFPQLELRTGITADIEIQLYWDGWNIDTTENLPSETIVTSVYIGSKYRIYQGTEYNLTMFGSLSLPSGSSSSTSNHIDPTLGLLWDYALTSPGSLFGEALFTSLETGNDRVYEAQFTIGNSFTLTDRLSSFIELYGNLASNDTLDNNIILNGAFQYLLTENIQFDIDAGVGLNDSSNDFAGFGLAFRF